MQAFRITYAPDDTRVALGWYDGLVEVATVDPTDGSPRDRLVSIFTHKHEIAFLAFVDNNRLVSVDTGGRIVVSSLPTGAVLHQATVGGEYVTAAIAPGGRTLFAFAYRGARDT